MGIEEQVGDTVRLALGRYWTFFGLSGLLLIVLAAGDGFPRWLVQLEPDWRRLTFACGCVLIAACFVAVVADVRRQPAAEARPELAGITATVLSPADRETAAGETTFAGTLSQALPDRFELWLFGCTGGAMREYWAIGSAEVTGTSFVMRVRGNWAASAGDTPYVFAAVGPNGQALLGLYQALNWRCVELCGKWAGSLTRLTDDIRICSPVRWVKWAEPASAKASPHAE